MERAADIPKPRARKFPILGCLVAIWVLIAIVTGAGFWIGASYLGGAKKRIAELEAGIRERGQPLTLGELNAYYPAVPDEENAALVYEEAFELIDAIDPGREQESELWDRLINLEPGAEIPPDLLEEMQKYLAERLEVLEVLDRAVQIPQARYPVDFQRGFETEFPHLAKLRSCARLEVIRGTVAAVEQHYPDYVACQERVLHMADTLRQEPVFISQLVRVALHSIAAEALVRDLNRAPLPRKTLDKLALLYKNRECSECLSRAVAGEWCQWKTAMRALFAESIVDRPRDVKFMDEIVEKSGGAAVFGHLGRMRYLRLLELLDPLTTANDTPWPERLKAAEDVEMASKDAGALDFAGWMFLPSIPGTVIALAREAAVLRLARTVLTVEQYRDATGALPDSLAQLVPEYLPTAPDDPFDGQPLRYKRTNSGYHVYSIYMNQIDDDGAQW